MGDFVRPEVVRLYLVDVHRRALADHRVRMKTLKGDELTAATLVIPQLEINIKDAERKGRYIDVKKRLTAGESRKMFAQVVRDMTAGERARLDPERIGVSKLLAYLLAWSLTDDDGHPVPFSPEALDSVDPDVYADMIKAVDWHEEVQDAARSAEKNGPDGATPSSTTSSLPSVADGVLSGSAI